MEYMNVEDMISQGASYHKEIGVQSASQCKQKDLTNQGDHYFIAPKPLKIKCHYWKTNLTRPLESE